MRDKLCLVTGANSGIGRATAEELARRGATVVMLCRDRGRGEAARARIATRVDGARLELLIADLASQRSVRRAAEEFKSAHPRLDVLINNAGVFWGRRQVTGDGLEATFAINHLGHFLLTQLLEEELKASAPSRIVNVSSSAYKAARLNLADLQSERGYDAMRAYGNSKLANILFTYELARRLDGSGVTANCLHPGVVRTRIGRNAPPLIWLFFLVMKPLLLSPAKGAATTVYLATSPEVERVSGKYFVKQVPQPTAARTYTEETARRLWEISEKLTDLTAADPTA
ncbi:MAG: SDR family oxidoreductase [Candidatus Palauibacterales bacterium]|nr:SDR family oxidoreductase [Candidatus Palauibacterales bacterium]